MLKIRSLIKNPFFLATLLALIVVASLVIGGTIRLLTGYTGIILGTFFLWITYNAGIRSFKGRLIGLLYFIITFHILLFLITLILFRDIGYSLTRLPYFLIYFSVAGLLINLLMTMKKGHKIAIAILSILTILFILYSFVQNIEAERFRKELLESQQEIWDQRDQIDSLVNELDKYRE